MAENSKIEWTDHTFNPWIGCTKVGPGCDNCYAEAREDKRLHRVLWGPGQPRHRTKTWGAPKKWNDRHTAFFAEYGRRQRVFCASLADVFDNEVDPAWRRDLFNLIADTQNLDWLLLTKRIGNAKAMIREAIGAPEAAPPITIPNLWIGATIVNQEEADRDIPKLLATPARVRFLSMEPLLGEVDLTQHLWGRPTPCATCPKDADCECGYTKRGTYGDPTIGWVIVGGESGPGARAFDIGWARELVQQCKAAGVPVMVKQLGAAPTWEPVNFHESIEGGPLKLRDKKGGNWSEWPEDLRVREFPL